MIYDELMYETIPDNCKVDGTFQRLRYINDRRDDIIQWLKPDPSQNILVMTSVSSSSEVVSI